MDLLEYGLILKIKKIKIRKRKYIDIVLISKGTVTTKYIFSKANL